MIILDLFCGAGGAAMGYHRAFPDAVIIGVDLVPQPNYPFIFIQGDALYSLPTMVADFVHASPPCQHYSTQTADRSRHSGLIGATRRALNAFGKPYVIENVQGATKEMIDPARLCGSSFGLDLRRHRLFETNWGLETLACDHAWQTPRFRSLRMSLVRKGQLSPVVGVHGHINYAGESEIRKRAMEINWMTDAELAQAIPPRYTEYIGNRFKELTHAS